uniref:D-dopachrome decarboxylase n=1 Tax=Oryzias sinensis TaxID=183150 RepID=A0A8C7XR60_9TELE
MKAHILLFHCATVALFVFQRMNVVVKPGLPMLMAGSCSPCVILSVGAISVTDSADQNKQHSAKIFEFLTKELSMTEDRLVYSQISQQNTKNKTGLESVLKTSVVFWSLTEDCRTGS